jgi:hypothetical protein
MSALSDLQQAQPLSKQGMCKHMADAESCKDEDADAANGQILNPSVYILPFNLQKGEGFFL